eukprot:PITA_06872
MANVFDRVNCSFLIKVLLSFGFSHHFVHLINACIDNLWIALLVNDRPSNFFQARRGIRQGCPLSPFLYILMADSLSRKLIAERIFGSLPGLKPSTGVDPLNHALFADDSLLLGGASTRISKAFDSVLKSYCRVSGALVNESKSEIYSWNTDQQELISISNTLGFRSHARWDRFKYLGLPITNGPNRRSIWSDIICKIKAKIAAWGGYWLTKGGKVILIKSLLSTLPIYQTAFLLAPRNVMDQISKLLRDFLWQGGKGNERKMHLANWDLVKMPIAEGGLQIRDPSLINLTLGGKLLWKLDHEPKHPISTILLSKYTHNSSFSNLQFDPPINSSQVWTLCCKSSIFFKKLLYRVLGNGKRTNLWKDRIMGCNPLEENEDIVDLRDWMIHTGINNLRDLSVWDRRGDWAGWDFHGAPVWLSTQKNLLTELLEDSTLENRHIKDSWAWGQSSAYSTAAGYKALQESRNNSHTLAFWKLVWDNLALPKVNFFFWTLIHNKILIGNNLEKRNIAGPHRCELCRSNHETSQHLFLDCNFTKEVWGLTLLGLQISPFPQSTVADLFASWSKFYPHSIPIKSFWNKVASKAKAFLLEAAHQQFYKYDSFLLLEERRWLRPLEPSPRKSILTPQIANPEWRRRDSEDSFTNWWRSKNLTTIFFDGASKGNPEIASSGGVIYSSDGSSRECLCWGLGQKSNNQAEIFGPLKACHIARDKGVKDLQVFRDFEILIKKLNTEDLFSNASLNKILGRPKRVLQEFTSYKFYHILRNLNGEADQMANKGCSLLKGQLILNDDNSFQIP